MKNEQIFAYESPQLEIMEIATEQCFATSPQLETEYLTGEEGEWY